MEERSASQLRLVAHPIIYRVLYIPAGAGFLPSTVWVAVGWCTCMVLRGWYQNDSIWFNFLAAILIATEGCPWDTLPSFELFHAWNHISFCKRVQYQNQIKYPSIGNWCENVFCSHQIQCYMGHMQYLARVKASELNLRDNLKPISDYRCAGAEDENSTRKSSDSFQVSINLQGEMRELAKLVGFDGSDEEWSQVGGPSRFLFALNHSGWEMHSSCYLRSGKFS